MSHRYFTRRITPATVFRALLSSALVGSFLMVNAAAAAEVNPISMPQIGDAQLRILSPTILELTLINTKEPDPARPTQWNFVDAHHTLALPAASELEVRAGTNKLSISTLGFKRRPLYAPVRSRDLRIENSLYLILSAPIANGQTVNVKNPSANYWNPDTSFSAVVDPLRFNPALHVNQSGYLPAAPKKGMVGFYLGSLGEMPLSGGPFHLINASGQTNFSGSLVRRPDRGFISSPAPYQQVFQADFTALQTPGEYRLYVPGLGCSFSFYIHDGAAANFSRTLALGLYHQRCGGKNEMPFTRHEHDTCHSAPAEIPTMAHESVNLHLAMITADFLDTPRHTAPQLKDVSSSLYPFVKQGTVNVSLGHHDAGDYSKYTINSAHLIHHLVFAADNFPGAGKLDNLRLPESSDGKSDLLQEAKWEADFLVRMQDTDGGFYFLVYPRDRLYEDDVLPDEGDSQVAFPKNTSATAAAVAALAEIGSSPLFRQQFPLRSQTYIQKALLGWSFLTNALAKHGKDGAYQKITHYGNEFMHDDELAWAAAALFAATGNPSFQTQLMAWYIPTDPNTRRWTWWRLFEGYGGAARSFAFAARSGRLAPEKLNPGYLAAVKAEIIAAADDVARAAEQSAYGTSFPEATKRHATAGWYFSSERAFELAAAQQIKPQARYMDALLSNVNYEGGCNPMNLPYITGLGWKRWRDIVSQYAQNDDRVLPPSGLLLGNIQSGFSWLENYKQELGALCFPADSASEAPYPFYDRWGDSFNTTTEATILDHSRSLATYALLHGASAASNSASIELFGTITGLPRSAPAGEPLTARFEASGIDLSQATVVWEARDQEPYIGEIYNFAAQNPGEQWVEVEATLPDGNRIVGHAVFNATTSETVPSNSHRSAPLKLAPEIVALYHLDSNGNDASERNPALTIQGNAGFNSFNLGWMAARSGAALRFYDLGDKATVTLPTQTPQFSQAQEITIEAMVYVNAYKAWNRSTATLVGLHKSWNAHLQWLDDTYSGQHIRGGTQFDLFGTLLNSAMPLHQWHHLSMTIDRNRYSARVNGKLIGITTSTELANWSGYPATLEIGNFDGWIDEVVVRNARTSNLPQLPSMPADFGATAVSSSEVRLQWRDTSTNESGFRIFRSANNIDFGEIGAPTADSTNFVDAALKPAASYHYVIAAFNFAGESEMLSTNVTTLPPLSLPAPNLRAQGNGTERIDLSWSDESPNETRFQIERSRDGMFFVRIATVAANSVKYSDWTSEPNRTYHYRVRAWNSETTSRYSNVASARARSYYTGKLH